MTQVVPEGGWLLLATAPPAPLLSEGKALPCPHRTGAASASATPFVHPNPSCVGYSPPPARRCGSTTSYFSVILPVARYVRRFRASQRSRAASARSARP